VFSQFIRIQTGYQQKPGIMDSLQMRIDREGELAVMYLSGRIDIGSSPQMRDELLALLQTQTPPGTIAIDLVGVAYMDTSGMATLVEALKFARMGNVRMYLRGLQGRLLHLFQSTGIGSLFDTSETANALSAKEVS
jgi:anti-sigma B factor antagonist